MATTGQTRAEERAGKVHVMEEILIFIKHNFRFIWSFIERVNGTLFNLFYKKKLEQILPVVLEECKTPLFTYKELTFVDIYSLHKLICQQPEKDLEFFRPHGFDLSSLKKQLTNSSFLMMGAFEGGKLVGYFFLRFFANRKCFVGRLIDKDYRGKGIGSIMNDIMYETAWRMGFRCLSTISRNNTAVMRAHAKNPTMIVLKELPNDYLLVEFVREAKCTELRAKRGTISDQGAE